MTIARDPVRCAPRRTRLPCRNRTPGMAYEATPAAARAIAASAAQRRCAPLARGLDDPRRGAPRGHLRRALLRPCERRPRRARTRRKFDEPALTHCASPTPLLAPLARWDAVWYLRIADSGYGDSDAAGGVLPALPAARPLGWRALGGGSPAALLIASYVSRWRAFLGALVLLYRLVVARARAPPRAADAAAARRLPGGCLLRRALLGEPVPALVGGRLLRGAHRPLGVGGRLRGGASATRSAGLLLLIPLAMLWWSSRGAASARRRLAPPRAARRSPPTRACLGLVGGRRAALPRRPGRLVARVRRPARGAWDGLAAAVDGVRQLASGSRTPVYFEQAGGDPFRIAAMNIMLFGFLVFALVALRGRAAAAAAAYGAYVAVALAAAALLPGRAAAADVAAALPGRAVPDLHVARARLRGAAHHRPRWRPCPRSGSACSRRSSRAGTASREPRAVLLDALGTLVELQPPAPRLRRALARGRVRGERGARGGRRSARRSPTTSPTTSRAPTRRRSTTCATAARR